VDGRAELIRQLLEYKKFKDAANLLSAAAEEQKQRFARPGSLVEQLKPNSEPAIDIEEISIWNLLEAFDSIMTATGGVSFDVSHITDDTPIDLYQIEILHRLQSEGTMRFERIFESKNNRVVMIGLFLALLELIREKLVRVKQRSSSGPLQLYAQTDEPQRRRRGNYLKDNLSKKRQFQLPSCRQKMIRQLRTGNSKKKKQNQSKIYEQQTSN
jgi:segregation and condensation protein A